MTGIAGFFPPAAGVAARLQLETRIAAARLSNVMESALENNDIRVGVSTGVMLMPRRPAGRVNPRGWKCIATQVILSTDNHERIKTIVERPGELRPRLSPS
jgi:hypothetical protein